VEFVSFGEVWIELAHAGVVETSRDATPLYRGSGAQAELVLGVAADQRASTLEVGPGAKGEHAIETTAEKAAATLEAVLHKLHLTPFYLVPVARWRGIFEIVSFALASNAHWQEVDSQASVELNTRDPLECGLRDLHTVRELLIALLVSEDVPLGSGASTNAGSGTATGRDHNSRNGLMLIATGQLIVATIAPHQAIRLEIGSATVAKNIRDAANHFLGRSPNGH